MSLDKPKKVLVCEFPYAHQTDIRVCTWVRELLLKLERDPRVGRGNYAVWHVADTPVTMSRNQALMVAEANGFDLALFVDADTVGDCLLGKDGKPLRPGVTPFWETAFDFYLAHDGPCVVAAPYSGPPPAELTYVFEWANTESESPNPNFQLSMVPRSKAATLRGVQPCAALPTGLMLIDMRAVARLSHPRFYYEWKHDGPPCGSCGVRNPGPQVEKASTEDVTFSRDLTYAGVPLYCTWSSWAAHIKTKVVGPPHNLPDDIVPGWVRQRAAELGPLAGRQPGPPPMVKPAVEIVGTSAPSPYLTSAGGPPA